MWNLLKKSDEECKNLRDLLEDSAVGRPEATREIFKGVASHAGEARPWFSTRVMTAIAARERELTEAARTWLAVPKFALRLAVASVALLLLTSTWLYEKPLPASNQQAASLAAQESLFEAPPPTNQDDVLVPMQENNP